MQQNDSHFPDGVRPYLWNQSFLERNHIHPIVFALACLFFVFVLYQLLGGGLTFLIAGSSEITRDNVSTIRFLTMLGQLLFILVPTLLFARLLNPRLLEVFPLKPLRFSESFFAILGLIFLQQILQIYLYFQEHLPFPPELRRIIDPLREGLEEMFRGLVTADSVSELLIVLVVVAIAPAIIEELFFRGLVQSAFERAVKPKNAAMIVGIIFGLYHFNPFALLPLMALGWYFGYVRMRSQSVLIAMTAHFVNNAMAIFAVYLGMEEDLIMGTSREFDPDIAAVVAQLGMYVILFLVAFTAYLRVTARKAVEEEKSDDQISR